MRLWHKDLIPVLPRQQLISQWRECCCIARNIAVNGTPNHLLVNKVMDYPIFHFICYSNRVAYEMRKRGYKCDTTAFSKWINTDVIILTDPFPDWHNDRYLNQCLMNLQEKFDCGGIGFCEYEKIMAFTGEWLERMGMT